MRTSHAVWLTPHAWHSTAATRAVQSGKTALMVAASYGHVNVILALATATTSSGGRFVVNASLKDNVRKTPPPWRLH